jgi:hypothetical protein
MNCPPINRLYFTPRQATLNSIIARFPKETEKQAREREKRERHARAQLKELNLSSARSLKVSIICGKDLASKDLNGFSGRFLFLKIFL